MTKKQRQRIFLAGLTMILLFSGAPLPLTVVIVGLAWWILQQP